MALSQKEMSVLTKRGASPHLSSGYIQVLLIKQHRRNQVVIFLKK